MTGAVWRASAAVVGFVIALAGLVVAWLALRQDRQFDAPDVSVEQVMLTSNKDVEGVAESDIPGEQSPTAFTHRDATIEVTLGNDGGTGARLTAANVRIERIAQLANCIDLGGPITASYDFDVTVPRDGRAPMVIQHPLNFEVPADGFDQLALTVGPASETEGAYPSVYLVEVELTTSDETLVTTPPVALLSSIHGTERLIDDLDALGHPEYFNAEMRDSLLAELRGCLDDNLQELQRVVEGADQLSPELERVLNSYTSVLRP